MSAADKSQMTDKSQTGGDIKTPAATTAAATTAAAATTTATTLLKRDEAQDRELVEQQILFRLSGDGVIGNSLVFAETLPLGDSATNVHDGLVTSVLQSLQSTGHVLLTRQARTVYTATPEGASYQKNGSPEMQVYRAVVQSIVSGGSLSVQDIMAGGVNVDVVKRAVGEHIYRIGFGPAKQKGWIKVTKGVLGIVTTTIPVDDSVIALTHVITSGGSSRADDIKEMLRRKWVDETSIGSFSVHKGPNYALKRTKQISDITADIQRQTKPNEFDTLNLKAYNFASRGAVLQPGALHPLLKVRQSFREILLGQGFSEMPTNRFVESSFWNFDSLLTQQNHPARDLQDTFFLKEPAVTKSLPKAYVDRIKSVHEVGGYGSIGFRYPWKESETRKNVLRTHTTAISSRMLYALAQERPFQPRKYFSIDRVFRNETLDATHLAEFHQIEGLIADNNLTLGDLIGTLERFFHTMGIRKLKFKPTYNPYTEPSMEIFGLDSKGKWLEVGNSGVFRPEMLRPMGFPENVSVIAWGLSLERPTMIRYGYTNIRDLFGHRVRLPLIASNPVCRFTGAPGATDVSGDQAKVDKEDEAPATTASVS